LEAVTLAKDLEFYQQILTLRKNGAAQEFDDLAEMMVFRGEGTGLA
jgi:hypothetical protein